MFDSFLSPKLAENISKKVYMQKNKPGMYIVATPIGNILDFSLRAIHILRQAEYVFAEDTRQARKLFDFYEIKTKLIACHEYNELDNSITSIIKNNAIYALISDAGTPLISDPGYRIINWCLNNNIDVISVPGASATLAALSISGLPTDRFMFIGFLPEKKEAQKCILTDLRQQKSTMIFFESPKRLLNTLKNMNIILGDRDCCICKEITKIFEESVRGKLSEVINHFSNNNPLGEFTVIVAGNTSENQTNNMAAFVDLEATLQKLSLKDSVKYISKKYTIHKNIIYQKALEIKKH